MVEMLTHGFMVRAFTAGILIGALLATLSVIVALKRLSFMGAGISHSAFGGIAIGALLGVDLTRSALVFCVMIALGIGWLSRRGKIHEDISVGVVLAASMAVGVVCLGLMKGYSLDLFSYLFGSILAVSEDDLSLAAGALAITAALMTILYKEFQVYCFDEEWARVCGVNVDRLQDILLTLIAAAVVVSIKLLGALLVSALLVIPGAVAYQLAGNYRAQFPIAIACSLVSVIAGLTLSYRFDVASGAAIALSASGIFLISTIFAPKWE
jgi:zinc transport system permease protein